MYKEADAMADIKGEDGGGGKVRRRGGTAWRPDWQTDFPFRHYVWGALIVAMGLFTIFGIWFLFGV